MHSGQCLGGRTCRVWNIKCGAQSMEGRVRARSSGMEMRNGLEDLERKE